MTVKEGKDFLKLRPDLLRKVWIVKAGFDNKTSVLKVGEERYPLSSVTVDNGHLVYSGRVII